MDLSFKKIPGKTDLASSLNISEKRAKELHKLLNDTQEEWYQEVEGELDIMGVIEDMSILVTTPQELFFVGYIMGFHQGE